MAPTDKRCSKCASSKALEAFGKNRQSPDGLHYWCKQCCKASRDKRVTEQRAYLKRYRAANKDQIAQYRRDNADKMAQYNSEYKPRKREWMKNRRRTDPNFRISSILRGRVTDCLVRYYGIRKTASGLALLGLDVDKVRDWLEFQFQPGMSWDNHGITWEIDHVLPVSRFDLTDPAQQRICFGWANLSPKLKQANRSKGNKIEPHDYFNCQAAAGRFIQSRQLGCQEYQRLCESAAWLRAKTSGMVTSSWMTEGF
jgi:hypothetical protein